MTTSLVPIGEFSRISLLSIKALRHYHDVGLLEPAEVDPHTGYRRYRPDQADTAQLIRRLRDLDMPVPDVAAVLRAPDDDLRNSLIGAHLDRMQSDLSRLSGLVTSLRAMLTPAVAPLRVEYRRTDAQHVALLRSQVSQEGIEAWMGRTFPQLYAAVASIGAEPSGPCGAIYSDEFFLDEDGEVLAFLPIPRAVSAVPGAEVTDLPGERLAVARHDGSYADIDRTYAALGSWVADHDGASSDRIREIYLIGPEPDRDPDSYRTEICWPVLPAGKDIR